MNYYQSYKIWINRYDIIWINRYESLICQFEFYPLFFGIINYVESAIWLSFYFLLNFFNIGIIKLNLCFFFFANEINSEITSEIDSYSK